MDWFLKLGFFSLTDKVTDAIGGAMPYIITGAVIVAIWIYFLFLVPKKEKRYDRVSDYLNDVLNFRLMLSSGLVKILYIAFALVVLIVGIVAIFAANFLVGLLGTIILEIVLRVMFEIFMVVFSIQENVTTIKEKQAEMESQYYYYDDEN
ncbi:MAG TPA: DUF4282 domain-containing protein [Clostridiaceae bacterium]|jgi:sensor histidine kinase YesM|nr:DUF4282 domain-containing protein [Clostridiaceae bacterium]